MKKGIFVTLVGLALVAFAVPYAQGDDGQDLYLSVYGSSFVTSSQDDGTPTPPGLASTGLQSGIAKGSGNAVFSSQTVTGDALPDARCPATLPLGGDLTVTGVFTFNDGSIFQLTTGAGNFFCTDGVALNIGEMAGTVIGGDGRFEGATGTWEGSAEVDGSRVTGNIAVHLD
jgi:hypothetical protein